MHSPSARALSHPQPLIHCPHEQKKLIMYKSGIWILLLSGPLIRQTIKEYATVDSHHQSNAFRLLRSLPMKAPVVLMSQCCAQCTTTHIYMNCPKYLIVCHMHCIQRSGGERELARKCSQLPTIQKESCKVSRPILSGKCKHPPPLQPEILHSWWLWKICYCHSLVCARWGKPTTRPISCLQRRRDRHRGCVLLKTEFTCCWQPS